MIRLATMTSVCPDWSLDEVVEGMKRHEYEGLEPRVGWGHAAGIELDMPGDERAAVRKRLEDEGLAICCVATGARFASPDPDELEKSLSEARAAIDLAADLGAPYVRTFGGARGSGDRTGGGDDRPRDAAAVAERGGVRRIFFGGGNPQPGQRPRCGRGAGAVCGGI